MDSAKDEFLNLLAGCQNAIERFVYYKIPNKQDAEDILQEVFLSGFQHLYSLKDKTKFKSWMLSIAGNKCNDYFKKRLRAVEIPLEDVYTYEMAAGKAGFTVNEVVRETLDNLCDKSKQILFLYYIKGLSQKDISEKLDIPIGTVKSRLHAARQSFKESYPYPPKKKGDDMMSRFGFPEVLPEIKITKSDSEVFEVVFEELPNWFVIPKLNQKTRWASYNYPERKIDSICTMRVTGKIEVHGVLGVEIHCDSLDCANDKETKDERILAAQLTDSHIRYLADTHYHGDVRSVTTFLDDDFLKNWGIGEDNCGREILLKPKGIIAEEDGVVTAKEYNSPDVVGAFLVEIGGKRFHTIRLMEADDYGVMTEAYIDKNGRTVLWRRYNRDDWAIGRYKTLWSERLPDNKRVLVNDCLYVHWYDCISDYIL